MDQWLDRVVSAAYPETIYLTAVILKRIQITVLTDNNMVTLSGVQTEVAEPSSWHSAHSVQGTRPDHVSVVSEAGTMYFGLHRVNKLRRLIWTTGSVAGPENPDSSIALYQKCGF